MKKDVEIWRDIIGYENLYQVSNWGRVRSLKSGKILRPAKNSKGYLRVGLYKDGKRKNYKVHRLVAEAFLKPVAGKDFVNHLNEIKTDNHYLNLEYCTAKENNNYGTRNERVAETLSKPVVGIDPKTGKVVVEFPSAREAGRNGYNNRNISECCLGKRKHHRGFIWRYK